jgi:predicted TIM-barrel fold metal-dependent hydrolase
MRHIDLHCHPNTEPWYTANGPYIEALREYWGRPWEPKEPAEVADEVRSAGVEALLVAFDTETVTGLPPCSNDYVAGMRDAHPDVFIGAWASVDPWKGALAISEAKRAINDLNMIGFHFHPICGAFTVDDPQHNRLFETIAELGVPILVDVGTTGMGAGMPGGLGLQLKFARPFPAIDDLASRFPEMTIIAAHPGWPWTDEMMAIALHKANVYWEMSGWGPKHLPASLKWDIPRRLQDCVMFASDYPSLGHTRLLEDWSSLGLADAVLEKVFHLNAERVLGFAPSRPERIDGQLPVALRGSSPVPASASTIRSVSPSKLSP